MPWVKVDDRFDDDPDIDNMSTDAIALFWCATTWSSRNMTDGFVPRARALKLPGGCEQAIRELTTGEKPWWVAVEGGFQIVSPLAQREARFSFEQLRRMARRLMLRVTAEADQRCALCGSRDQLQVDHVIPLARDGTNEPTNLQWLCRSCNARKGAR